MERVDEIAVHPGVPGLERDHAAKRGERVVKLPLPGKSHAEIVVRLRVIRT